MMRRIALLAASIILLSATWISTAGTALAVQNCTDSGDEWKVCERYPRSGQQVILYYGIEYRGNGGWGYEHIKSIHSWSLTHDSYVRTTIATAPDPGPAENGKFYYVANPNNEPGCMYTVVVNYERRSYEPAARHIETAYGNGSCSVN